MNKSSVPPELFTGRLHLRCWRVPDAEALLPVLQANVERLTGWIPAHVAEPAPLDQLRQRLAGYVADFLSDRNWRYAMFEASGTKLVGEVSMFPRSSLERVELAAADRVEVGYWLTEDATGRGYATEAARAMLALAAALPGLGQVEIRCDPRNEPSAAVPRRLHFRLAFAGDAGSGEESGMMLWVYSIQQPATPDAV